MDYKGATSPLEQWAALAVRDAKAHYRDSMKEEEREYFAAGGVKKAGARISILERVASKVAVSLSENFLAEADAVEADALSVQQAQSKATGFFDHVWREAQALACYVHPGQSVLNTTKQLIDNLRSDFADRTESFLSKRKIGMLREISNPSVSHRCNEVLYAVQARHVEKEEQFQAGGRGFENDSFVKAQVGYANDRVIDFLRDEVVSASVEPAHLKALSLQLHSEALARIYMGLRRDEFGGLRLLSNECADVFATKRNEGIQRIVSEIETMPFSRKVSTTAPKLGQSKTISSDSLNAAWVQAKSLNGETITETEFTKFVVEQFPDHHIPRTMIRQLTKGRRKAGRPKSATK